jgi:dephospho-CoA kinase
MLPLQIALTGNEGSGLHDVGSYFKKNGVEVFNADIQLKWILNYDEYIIGLVKRKFGEGSVTSGFLNPLYFNNDSRFDDLIDIVEFKLFDQLSKFRFKSRDKCYIIFLSSLLHERNWINRFDMTVMVTRSTDERIESFYKNSEYSISQAKMIFSNEMSQSDKSINSEFVLDNLSKSMIDSQVKNIDSQIVNYYLKTRN